MNALYKWLAGLVLVASVLGGAWWKGHSSGFADGSTSVQARWDAQKLVDAAARTAELTRQAAERAKYDRSQVEAENAAKRYLDSSQAEHAHGLSLAEQLRHAGASVCSRAAGVPSAPASAASSGAAAGPGLVLSDVLGGLGSDGAEMALEADARRAAGLRCQAGREVSQ